MNTNEQRISISQIVPASTEYNKYNTERLNILQIARNRRKSISSANILLFFITDSDVRKQINPDKSMQNQSHTLNTQKGFILQIRIVKERAQTQTDTNILYKQCQRIQNKARERKFNNVCFY